MQKKLASSIFGQINPPSSLGVYGVNVDPGMGQFLNLIFNLLVIGAGLYALINFLLAGYSFMSAGDDPKKIEGAWAKIWQTVLGLAFTAGAFVLAAIFGWIIFGSPTAILSPTIPTP
jgi:hypothetical protein